MVALPASHPSEMLRFLDAIWVPGDVRELRVPKHNVYGHTASGYFDSPAAFASAVAKWDGRANVFLTLNPVLPDLLARAQSRTLDRAETTTADSEVVRRHWLLVDVDPDRPSGISSTDQERAAALAVLENAVSFLSAMGWPMPLTAMSGNGYYALYPIDLDNSPETTSLLKEVLGALATRFDTEAAHIDATVYNAARIVGAIGTKKVKGDETADRPHRRSHLLQIPEDLVKVSKAQLQALAETVAPEPVRPASVPQQRRASLASLLESHGLAYREQPPDANAVTWYHVERCPFHEDGRDWECGVGQKLPGGPFAGHCFHPEGKDKGWPEWKVALGLEVGTHHLRSISQPSASRRPTDFPLTDAGNAELFAHLYADQLRYDHRRNRWYVWDEYRWGEDQDSSVVQRAIEAVRQRYISTLTLDDPEEKARQAKFAIQSENRQRLDALLAIAKTKPPIADRGDAWDANPWLLGVGNGVTNLKTGELLPGLPNQRLMRFTDIHYDPDATCPRWLQFLDEVFGDADTTRFIWKAVGYSVTGDICEQCLFTCYGNGSNGKSVFLNVLRDLAGSYAYNAPFSILEMHNKATIPNDVAALAGARLVTASETNDGTRLNEARLKALTGGDPMTARFLHGEFFTFEPLAKLWLAVNHLPRVNDQSHGFWRRLRTIPFERTFAKDQDKQLIAKLRREMPGILSWAIRGCLAWQAEGLGLPSAVETATDTYRKESDPLGEFIEDACVLVTDAQCGANEAYHCYLAWATGRGMKEREKLSSKVFGIKMTERFPKKRSGSGNVYVGIGLRSNRLEVPPDPTPVHGRVQGHESDAGSSLVFPPEESPTRENNEEPYTTLHPTQTPEDISSALDGDAESTPAWEQEVVR